MKVAQLVGVWVLALAVAVIADRASGAEERVREAGVDYRAAYSLADLGLA